MQQTRVRPFLFVAATLQIPLPGPSARASAAQAAVSSQHAVTLVILNLHPEARAPEPEPECGASGQLLPRRVAVTVAVECGGTPNPRIPLKLGGHEAMVA
mmetsp:Transcript_73836/g.164101  ORF Transcript_73836/g.164101 Transcript_73836/m.164101 type:complete len:100 (-) Transcript_73836:201-500(-)